jgi:hypothetical protein
VGAQAEDQGEVAHGYRRHEHRQGHRHQPWDAASGGNLFLKGDFTGIGLVSGDSILFTIKAVFA